LSNRVSLPIPSIWAALGDLLGRKIGSSSDILVFQKQDHLSPWSFGLDLLGHCLRSLSCHMRSWVIQYCHAEPSLLAIPAQVLDLGVKLASAPSVSWIPLNDLCWHYMEQNNQPAVPGNRITSKLCPPKFLNHECVRYNAMVLFFKTLHF
jgi:hypothetical protein